MYMRGGGRLMFNLAKIICRVGVTMIIIDIWSLKEKYGQMTPNVGAGKNDKVIVNFTWPKSKFF